MSRGLGGSACSLGVPQTTRRRPVMAKRGLLLLLLLLALLPLQPSSLPRPDTTEGKVTIADLILSALERATLFLEERLPEVNLDGVVGFRVLQGT